MDNENTELSRTGVLPGSDVSDSAPLPPQKPKKVWEKIPTPIVWWAVGLGLFWVVFLWEFWGKGIHAFGFNATIFLLLFVGLFFHHTKTKASKKETLVWLIPFLLIAVSFSIFENPFLKVVNFFVVPLILWVFFSYSLWNVHALGTAWNLGLLLEMFFANLTFLTKLGFAKRSLAGLIPGKESKSKNLTMRIVLGVLIFLAVAIFIVLPLLVSADPVFAEKLSALVEWLKKISWEQVWRFVFFIFLSWMILAMAYSWKKRSLHERNYQSKKRDSVIAGIVLGGILVIYAFFIWVQLEHLWIDFLPIEFAETENLVKSGFWQLFLLSLINIVFYFLYYKKTNPLVQKILIGFTTASLLILFSAAQRMYLYVMGYGFSYEKFFASYTVVYLVLLFVWLIFSLLRKQRADILKFLIFSLLWMYAALTVFPVEQFVFKANFQLAQKENSRIDMSELVMLSADVLPLVQGHREQLQSQLEKKWLEREPGIKKSQDEYFKNDKKYYQREKDKFLGRWDDWLARQNRRLEQKKWFEMSVSSLINII